jgi:hypothetical protein
VSPKGLVLALSLAASPALAQGGTAPVTVDSVAVRFYAPDIGGVAHARFITARQVSFEARLLALEEDPSGSVQPRHVRAAIDSHVAEEILGALPLEPPADNATLSRTVEIFRAGTARRVGGPAALERAEKLEGITPRELDLILVREARAAIYVDRSLTPILSTNEDQLRETYRTTSNPFRGRRFEDIRDDLSRWLVIETFRAAEQAYLQTARSRIATIYL